MNYHKLGRTELKVSHICLGTMTWAEQNTKQQAHEQLDYAMEQGINFIDTAELYPVPPKAETCGHTETIIGDWLAQRGNRHDLILASKVAARSDWIDYMRDGHLCLNRENIENALNASLKRLQTDYLDLYQLHWPDRHTNFFGQLGYTHETGNQGVPLEETLEVLDQLVKSGKIRHVGISNETPWGAMHFLHLAKSRDLPRMVSIQNPYNLLNRSYEIGLAEISHREDMGLLAYSPLAFGVLSGKYLNNSQPDGARLTLFTRFDRYNNEQAVNATKQYVMLAKEHGLDPAQMALAYVNSRPFLTSTIIGATTMEQLRLNIDSSNITLSAEVLAGIESIHTRYPNPSP